MVNPTAQVRINTMADTTNRRSVKSDAILFSHDDVTPDLGDSQVRINKETQGNTASPPLQTV